MPQLWQALSIKQPWAALLVHGVKTVEIRSWCTGKRGKILIHASKSPEADPEAWKLVTSPKLMETAGLVGGIIGVAELCECITYANREDYMADALKHCTGGERFREPQMYGFRFRKPKPVAFLPWLGNTNFFGVDADIEVKKAPRVKRTVPPKYVVRLPEQSP